MDAALVVMAWVRLALLIIASAYGVFAIRTLSHEKNNTPILRIKKRVFMLLTAAVFLFTLGVGAIHFGTLFAEQNFPSAADIPIVVSHILFIAAFIYFWVKTADLHRTDMAERIFFSCTIFAALFWVVFLLIGSVMPAIEGEYLIAKIFYIAYPMLVTLMFLSTLIVNPRLKAAIITTPLWYVSTAVFLHFLAFMTQYYTIWHPMTRFIPAIYSFLYILSAGFFVIGFYTISKKYARVIHKNEKESFINEKFH